MYLHNSSTFSRKKLRIGEFLINGKLIDQRQLDEAIEYQCIYGGKLGTCLVELGFIDEWQFAKTLSKYHNLDYVEPHELMNVPQQIIDLLPAEVAVKYQAVPYRVDKSRLFIAISESTNQQVIDALTRATRHTVIPMAMPEIRIKLALKKYYAMPLPSRFESLAARIDKHQFLSGKAGVQKQTSPSPSPVQPETEENDNQVDTASWPMLGDQENPGEIEELLPASYQADQPARPMERGEFLKRLANIQSREQIAEILFNYLRQNPAVSALWVIREQKIIGWKNSLNSSGFEELSFPLDHQSLLGTAVISGENQLGPLDQITENRRLANYFTAAAPHALVIPLTVRDRIVCVFYAQDELNKLQTEQNNLLTIARKMELAFNLLILRNKIIET